MRRALPLVVALLLVFVTLPAHASTVVNERYSETVVEGWWSSGEWGDPEIAYGYVGARETSTYEEIYFYESRGVATICDNGTPDIPGDDYIGYVWTSRDGWGPATVDIARRLGSGSATGIVDAWEYTYSDCEYGYGTENGGNGGSMLVEVNISMTADGPKVTSRNHYSYKLPGEYNEHGRSVSTYRPALGTATVDGMVMTAEGQLGTWVHQYHVGSK